MTCGVAVFNRRGVAVAASGSSAMSRVPRAQVAIVTIGDAMMDASWNYVLQTYVRQLRERTFATVDTYATDFFHFVETSDELFPARAQSDCFQRRVRSVWSDYRDRIETSGDSLGVVLAEDRREFVSAPRLTELPDGFGTGVVASYAAELEQLEGEIFGHMSLARARSQELRAVLALMLSTDWCHPSDESTLVFCGRGDDEAFPSVLVYSVGSVVAGRLRRIRRFEVRADVVRASGILPFGQCPTIETVIDGVHPDLRGLLRGLRPHVSEQLPPPFEASIAELSCADLARMAESLVTMSAITERVQVVGLPMPLAV